MCDKHLKYYSVICLNTFFLGRMMSLKALNKMQSFDLYMPRPICQENM